jgi:hypothetical protein
MLTAERPEHEAEDLYQVPRLRMNRAVRPFTRIHSWRAEAQIFFT